MTFSNDLTWTAHIKSVCSKANQRLGFIRRNLRGGVSQNLRNLAYTSLVLPGMEYACAIWDPHLQKDKTDLEKLQRRAARWVSGDWDPRSHRSVTAMLRKLNWPTLEARRERARLALMYKVVLFEEYALTPCACFHQI